MKFDVVIGNPPYQINVEGAKTQATPIYNKFVESAKAMKPKYISMITPSRWFAGGMGLTKFREEMLSDKRISRIVDFPNAKDVFPSTSIGGGVNYFVWEYNHNDLCTFVSMHDGTSSIMDRDLGSFNTFIRYNEGYEIVNKIKKINSRTLTEISSPLSPFGIKSSERGSSHRKGYFKLNSSAGTSYIDPDSIDKGEEYIDKYNVMISKVTSEHAGEPDIKGQYKVLSRIKIMEPKEVCTFSYLLIGNFGSELEAKNLYFYMNTKFSRFLLLQSLSSINISRNSFQFVPLENFTDGSDIDWSKTISEIDQQLYNKYNLNKNEIEFIENTIKEME